jgi:hypothetical protein
MNNVNEKSVEKAFDKYQSEMGGCVLCVVLRHFQHYFSDSQLY